jgi:Pentapeptide repeats (8 copies)
LRRQRTEQFRASSLLPLALVVLGLATVTAALVALVELPRRLVLHDLGAARLPPADLAKAVNDARAILVQGLVGLAFFAGAFLTWRQVRVTREGQITERFTRAVDQLGSDRVDVRIGGVYALERIARNSLPDRGPIAEVLSAFVRGRAAWYDAMDQDVPVERLPPMRARFADVQAAMTVLGRRIDGAQGTDHLWLSEVDLRKARLDGACLNGARLQYAHLEGAALVGAELEGALLRHAHLEHAFLDGASLQGADLRAANLEGTDLRRVLLRGALANAATVWPAGFDPKSVGVRIEDS